MKPCNNTALSSLTNHTTKQIENKIEITVYKLDGLNTLKNIFSICLIIFHRHALHGYEMKGNLNVCICDLTFEIRAPAVDIS